MNFSAPFIHRPIGTTLLTIALALAGAIAYQFLPVSPLPQVEFPTIDVQAALPGASPEIMASAVATPLERQFGRIAGLNEMTSTSFLGSTRVTLQFDLSRNINAAARDVQAAINAARGQLPAYRPVISSYRPGAAVRLADVADVVDASADIRNSGLVNGKPAVLLPVWRQPGANIISTVDRVRAILPHLQAEIPPTVTLMVVLDR